jgi:hypothetical protein
VCTDFSTKSSLISVWKLASIESDMGFDVEGIREI